MGFISDVLKITKRGTTGNTKRDSIVSDSGYSNTVKKKKQNRDQFVNSKGRTKEQAEWEKYAEEQRRKDDELRAQREQEHNAMLEDLRRQQEEQQEYFRQQQAKNDQYVKDQQAIHDQYQQRAAQQKAADEAYESMWSKDYMEQQRKQHDQYVKDQQAIHDSYAQQAAARKAADDAYDAMWSKDYMEQQKKQHDQQVQDQKTLHDYYARQAAAKKAADDAYDAMWSKEYMDEQRRQDDERTEQRRMENEAARKQMEWKQYLAQLGNAGKDEKALMRAENAYLSAADSERKLAGEGTDEELPRGTAFGPNDLQTAYGLGQKQIDADRQKRAEAQGLLGYEGIKKNSTDASGKFTYTVADQKRIQAERDKAKAAGYYDGSIDPSMLSDEALALFPEAMQAEADKKQKSAEQMAADYEARTATKAWEAAYDFIDKIELRTKGASRAERVGRRKDNIENADNYFRYSFDQDVYMLQDDPQVMREALYNDLMYGRTSYAEITANMTPEEKTQLDGMLDNVLEEAFKNYGTWDPQREGQYEGLIKESWAYGGKIAEAQQEQENRQKIKSFSELAATAPTNGDYDPELRPEPKLTYNSSADTYIYEPQGTELEKAYFSMNEYTDDDEQGYGHVVNKYVFASDEQKLLFNRLYKWDKQNGTNYAGAYLEGLDNYLQSMLSEYQDTVIRMQAEDPVLGTANRILSYPENVIGGFTGLAGTGAALLGVDSAKDKNSSWYLTSKMVQTTREQQNENLDKWAVDTFGDWAKGKVKFLANVVDSIGDNLFAMGTANMMTGNVASKAGMRLVQLIMSGEATSNTMLEKLEAHMDPTEAALYSIGDGVIEWITEKWSLEALLKPDVKAMLGNKKQIAAFLAKTATAEGSEEIASDLLNMCLDKVLSNIYGHEDELKKRYDELVVGGMTDTEATRAVLNEKFNEVAMSGLAGAISGGIMGGGRVVSNTITQNRMGRNINQVNSYTDQNGTNQLIEKAKALGGESQSARMAAELEEKIKNGEKISDKKLGQLAQNIQMESQEQAASKEKEILQDAAEKELRDKSFKAQEAKDMAELIVRQQTEGVDSLSRKERMMLQESPTANQVIRDLNGETELSERVSKEIGEQTKVYDDAAQAATNLMRGRTAEGIDVRTVGKQLATQDEIDRAEGKRTKSPREVIVDREFGELEGMARGRMEDGKFVPAEDGAELNRDDVWKYAVKVNGKTKYVDATDIKGTNFSTAAVIRDQAMDPYVYSGRYTNLLIDQIEKGNIQNVGRYLSDAYRIRWAAYTGKEMPQTGIAEEAAREIYRLSQMDKIDERKVQKEQANFKGAGNGTATFKDAEYGTQEFEDAIRDLDQKTQDRIRFVADWAKTYGIDIQFADLNDTKNPWMHGSESSKGIVLNLESYDNKANQAKGIKHNIVATLGHEATHWLQRNNAAAYYELEEFVLNKMQAEGYDVAQRAQEIMESRRKHGQNISMTQAIDEIVANACDQVLGNPETVNELKKQHGKLYTKLKEYVNRLIDRIKSVTADLGESASIDAQRIMYKYGNELAKLWNGAMDEVLTGKIRQLDEAAVKEAAPAAASVAENFSMAEEAMPLEDALREWDEAKKERDALRQQYQELNGGKEHMDMLRKVQDTMGTPEADAAIEEYSRWEKETGLGDLARRYEEAKKRTDEAAKNYDRAYNAAQEAEEREAIAKSGLSEEDWRRKQAVKEFGYTTNFREAGYLMPNGQMLNFTGEKGKHYGTRGQDHRAIGTIYAGDRYTGSEAMLKFMDEGNIRVMAETPGIDISSTNEPTSEQYSTIRKMARQFASEEYFNIDFTDARGNTVDSIEYDGRVNPEKIVNDIKYFFRTGAAPQQSIVSQFHYSMAEDDAADIGVWMMSLTPSSVHTEGERALIQEYRGLKTTIDLTRKKLIDYRDQLKRLQKKDGMLTTDERDTVAELEARIQTNEEKMARLEQELYEVTRGEGYAAMMYRNSQIYKDHIEGKSQIQVEAAVDQLMSEVEDANKEIGARQKVLNRMSEESAVKTVRRELRNRGLKQNAAALKDGYFTTMSNAELEARLAEIVVKAVNGEEAESIKTAIDSLAADIVNSPVSRMAEDAQDALRPLKGRTVTFGPSEQAELKAIGYTLAEIRSMTKGSGITFKFGKNSTLQGDLEEIAKEAPAIRDELMDKSTSAEQAAVVLVDWVAGKMKDMKGNPKDFNFDTKEVSFVVLACMQQMLNENQGGMTRAALRKRIDTAAGEIGKMADAVNSLMETVQKIRQNAIKASNAAGGLRGDMAAAVDYYNLIARQAAEVERARVKRDVIEKLRSENTKKLIEQQQKYQEMMKKDRRARELQKDNESLRKVITTDAKRLKDRLVAETDQKNIPEEAKPLARMLVSMLVNHDMAGWRRVLNADKKMLADVQTRLAKMDEMNGTFDMDADLDWLVIKTPNPEDYDYSIRDSVLVDLMNIEQGLVEYRTAEGRGNVSLQDRKNALDKIQKAVSEIYDVIKARETAFIQGQKWQVYELAEQMEKDMENSRFKGERTGKIGKAVDSFWRAVGYGNLTPEYFIKNLKNRTMSMLHRGMHEAEQQSGLQALAAKKRLEQIAKDTGYATWDGQQKHQVKLENGKVIEMSTEQIMSLYATWNREKNQLRPEETAHLLHGGFVLAKGDTTKGVYGRDQTKQRPTRMSENDLNSLGGYLTDQQKAWVDKIVEYMSTDMAKIGNEASMKAYGIKKFTEKYYFPIKSWGGVLNKSSSSGVNNQNENRAMRQSFSRRVMNNARNAIEIGDFTATAMKHITGMITFNTVGPAVENLNKVLNQQLEYNDSENMDPDENYKRNMRAAFVENYGQAAYDYLTQFMKDVNGGVGRRIETSMREKLLSMFKKNAVAGSLSVAAQQPLSYIRAAMLINPKYLAAAISPQYWKGSYQEMLEHSGLAVIKDMGKFDMNFGQSMTDYITPDGMKSKMEKVNDASEKLTSLPGKMDAMTWTRMWSAVKLEQAALHPEMDVKSEEFLDMVADRFNELMRRTQVYDSVMVKSQNMRSDSYLKKVTTSFMAEPTLSLNVLADAWMNLKEKGGKANAVKALATFILSAAAQAGAKAFFGTGRSPDKKKTEEENFLNKFLQNLLSEANPFGLIPGYSQLVEVLINGELNDDAMGMIGKATDAVQKIFELATGDIGKKGLYRDLEDSIGQVVQLATDVPLKNVMRDFRAMMNWFSGGQFTWTGDQFAQRETSAAVLRKQSMETLMTKELGGLWNKALEMLGNAGYKTDNTSYVKRIYEAQKKGNEAEAAEIREYMEKVKLNGSNPGKWIDSQLNALTKEDDSLSTEEKMETLSENGYGSMGKFINDQYRAGEIDRKTAEERYRKENPTATDKDVAKFLDKTDWEKAGKPLAEGQKNYTNYTPLYVAMQDNKAEDIRDAVEHMKKIGYTEKDIKKEVNGEMKKRYMAADANERIRLKDAMEKAYKALGFTAEDADKTISSWTKEKKEGSSAIPGMVGVIGGNGMSDVGSKKKSGNYGKGNINLDDRPIVVNKDGSISTERSFSFWDEDEQKEILIPTVINGKIVSERKAIDHYYETGEYLGKFDTWQEADEYAEQTHSRFEIPNEDGTPYIANYKGKRIVLDSVIDGEAVSFEEAFQWYLESGDMLASFKTYKEAQRYVKSIMK